MNLENRTATTPEQKTPREITCHDYRPLASTNRCRHYVPATKACTEGSHLACIEWLRMLAEQERTAEEKAEAALKASKKAETQEPAKLQFGLYGPPEAVKTKAKAAPQKATKPAPAAAVAPAPLPELPGESIEEINERIRLTHDDVESFKALDAEVCIDTPKGEFWLVDEYSGRTDRTELSADDWRVISNAASVFEGTKIVSVTSRRQTTTSEQDNTPDQESDGN
jgi:hypothetical protein